MTLHLPTLDIVAVFTTLVAAGVSLLAWYRHRDAVALRSWAAALVLGSVGALLFSLREPSTSAAVFVAADGLCVASFATMWVSMRRFNSSHKGHLVSKARGERDHLHLLISLSNFSQNIKRFIG